MEKENTTSAHVVSLEVMDLDEDNLVELPVIFTRPKLPVTMENVTDQHVRQELSSVGWLMVRLVGRHVLMLPLQTSSRLTYSSTNSLRTIATWNSTTLHTVKLH